MSNVLIGIIGVILFIGLALAGALFLGPRFQDATINSKASAVVTAIQQVQSAVELYKVNTGETGYVRMGAPDWLAPDYLKTMPANPIRSSSVTYWNTVNINNDPYPDTTDEGKQMVGRYAIAVLGSDSQADRICATVAKNTGTTVIPAYSSPLERIGCEKYTNPDGSFTYIAFGAL